MMENKQLEILSAQRIATHCAEQILEHKGQDLSVLNVSRLSSFADYFVICSARSSRQAQGIADNVEMGLRQIGVRPIGIEGSREGQWILMDYGDVIVHIFYEPVRLFYDLESLWSDAERVQLASEHAVSSTANL